LMTAARPHAPEPVPLVPVVKVTEEPLLEVAWHLGILPMPSPELPVPPEPSAAEAPPAERPPAGAAGLEPPWLRPAAALGAEERLPAAAAETQPLLPKRGEGEPAAVEGPEGLAAFQEAPSAAPAPQVVTPLTATAAVAVPSLLAPSHGGVVAAAVHSTELAALLLAGACVAAAQRLFRAGAWVEHAIGRALHAADLLTAPSPTGALALNPVAPLKHGGSGSLLF